jgi:glutaredoxin
MSKPIVFTLEICPNCLQLKQALTDLEIDYDEMDMQSAEGITELRVNGCFAMEAPVLMIGDNFYETNDLFSNGKVDEKKLQEIYIGGFN